MWLLRGACRFLRPGSPPLDRNLRDVYDQNEVLRYGGFPSVPSSQEFLGAQVAADGHDARAEGFVVGVIKARVLMVRQAALPARPIPPPKGVAAISSASLAGSPRASQTPRDTDSAQFNPPSKWPAARLTAFSTKARRPASGSARRLGEVGSPLRSG